MQRVLRCLRVQSWRGLHTLGYAKPFELSKDGHVYEAFIKINDQQFIELYPVSGAETQIGFLHVCFESKDIASVNAFDEQERLAPTPVKKAGAGKSPRAALPCAAHH